MPIDQQGRTCWTLAVALIVISAVSAAEFQQPQPLEPEIAAASDEAAQAMKGIRFPPQWQIQLFAAEPQVANVVALHVDNRGRVFVCESFRQNRGVTDNRAHDEQWVMADLAAQTVQDRIDYHLRLLGDAAITYAQHDDRVRRLEDTDGDGTADRIEIVANGFNGLEEGTGAGVLARGEEIYYACIPKLWKLIDRDDDGKAEDRLVLSDGYGVRVAFRGHDLHGLILGPDGRLYFSIGDRGYHITTSDGRVLADPESGAVFRCELDGSGLEVVATGMRNPQELAFNDLGDLFTVDNNSDSGDKARILHILQGGDFGWRMHYQYLPDRGPYNRERIWEPLHPQQPASILPPVANLTDGPSGLAYYPGTGFGDFLKDTFLICDFRGGPANSGVRSFKLEPSGASYRLADPTDLIWTVLATDVAFAPDGGIYLSDWVDGWNGLGKGRIYRLTDPEFCASPVVKEVQHLLQSDWSGRTTEQLADNLGHVDRRIRLEAHWELARRSDKETLLAVAVDPSKAPLARLHAIWGADQIARLHAAQKGPILNAIGPLLNDDEATIRAAAAKVLGQRGDSASSPRLRRLLGDSSARVRYFAAMALANLRDTESFGAIVKLLAENQDSDPAIRHAAVVFLANSDAPDSVASLEQHASASVRQAAVAALRRMRSGQLTRFLDDPSPAVVLEAARAIYDQPVPVALRELADMILQSGGQTELIRRVLNANYRLGTAEAATRLADYAGRTAAPPEMRIEALDMLGQWARPDPRDRVLGALRPLPRRQASQARAALTPQVDALMASQESVREKGIDVAARLGIQGIAPPLAQRVADSRLSPAVRAKALSALARLDPGRAVDLARNIKLSPATELLHSALLVLAEHDAKASVDKFVQATHSRRMNVRQLAWDILARSESPMALAAIIGGVQAYLNQELTPDVRLNVMDAAKGKLNEKLRRSLTEYHRELAANDPLGPWLQALEGGDVASGKRIFFENTKLSCLRCHKVGRAGGEVGPELTLIGKQKDRRYLLESICLPDAKIAEGFETAIVVDETGSIFTGVVKANTETFIELIENSGIQRRIPIAEIADRKTGNSSMPQDLVKQMTMRQLRDLVAYLASLTVDPRVVESRAEEFDDTESPPEQATE